MIRDPSDGSVKTVDAKCSGSTSVSKTERGGSIPPASANNWGLKSLDKEARKPKPAPTADELRAHYAKHNLAFQPKNEGTE